MEVDTVSDWCQDGCRVSGPVYGRCVHEENRYERRPLGTDTVRVDELSRVCFQMDGSSFLLDDVLSL